MRMKLMKKQAHKCSNIILYNIVNFVVYKDREVLPSTLIMMSRT